MTRYLIEKNEDGEFVAFSQESGDYLATPNDQIISSSDRNVIAFVADYVSANGLELNGGMSPYGLESSYIDFGFKDDPDSKKDALRSALADDIAFSERYLPMWLLLSQQLGWSSTKDVYQGRLDSLSGRQLCVMIVFCANFGLPSIGYHLLIDGKNIPPELARLWCRIFAHVNRFDDSSSRRKALNGMFVDQNSMFSIEPDDGQLSCCENCCDRRAPPNSRCLIGEVMNGMRSYSKLSIGN